MLAVRITGCLLALALAGYALARRHQTRACQSGLHAALRVEAGRPAPAPAAVARTVTDHCVGAQERAGAAIAMSLKAPGTALALARASARAQPDDTRAWLAVVYVSRGSRPALARSAEARELALNPFGPRLAPRP